MPQATRARASIVLAHHMTAPTPCERNSLCSGRLTLRCAVLEPARRGAAAASALLAYAGHDREALKYPRGKEDERRTLSDDAAAPGSQAGAAAELPCMCGMVRRARPPPSARFCAKCMSSACSPFATCIFAVHHKAPVEDERLQTDVVATNSSIKCSRRASLHKNRPARTPPAPLRRAWPSPTCPRGARTPPPGHLARARRAG
eukprot:COSAG04_NODE_615_length_11914_cov_12.688447_9_plen_203_part_00